MKNILELCLSPDLGGLELYMIRASQFLHNKNNVISVIGKNNKLEQYYKNASYKYIKIKKQKVILSFLTAKKLARIVDKNSIDIIHLHWTKDIPIAVLAKIFSTCKPKLVQTRNMTMTRFKDDFYHKWLYKNMDLILPVTYQVQKQLERFIPKEVRPEIEMLYMGVDSPKLLDKEEKDKLRKKYNLKNKFTITIVGRIEKTKGQYLVIDAVQKLLQKGVDVQALIIGHAMNKNYLKELKTNIYKNNSDTKIIFTGFTKEAQKLMQICDCLILATPNETFGLVLAEAMRSKVAVIATNNGGPLEIIDNKQNGLLFKQNDSDDLVKKIKMLLDKKLKDKLAKNGAKKAQEFFDSIKQFEKLNKIFETM